MAGHLDQLKLYDNIDKGALATACGSSEREKEGVKQKLSIAMGAPARSSEMMIDWAFS